MDESTEPLLNNGGGQRILVPASCSSSNSSSSHHAPMPMLNGSMRGAQVQADR